MEEGRQSGDLAEEINQQYPMDLSGQELNGGWISTEVGQKHDQGGWHGNCLSEKDDDDLGVVNWSLNAF